LNGIKLVDVERVCVDKTMYQALATIAAGALGSPETIRKLVWED